MRRISEILTLFGILILFGSCKKDIEIDYHTVAPLYVIEASVTNDGMKARVSRTNAMDDNTTTSDITGATVIVTGSDGTREQLFHKGKGIYQSSAIGTPDVVYTIDVEVDGQHFTSSSTMQKEPMVNDFYFIRKKIVGENFLMAKLLIQDIPNEENYYFAHLYRNGTGFRWAVKKDDTDPNKEQQILFTFAREGSNDKDLPKEGDRFRLEVRTIDRKSYDYLFSMQQMDNTGTNPIPDFTGGCLGYFSAYSQLIDNYVFRYASVSDEE